MFFRMSQLTLQQLEINVDAVLSSELAKAQKAGRKPRIKSLHAKIKNRRKHGLHQIANKLIDQAKTIVVGDVSSSKLVKTSMAKSVNDVGWYMLKTMLSYKAIRQGVK